MVALYVFSCIFATIFLASIVPICQYIYYTYIRKETAKINYDFSEELFDRHLSCPVCIINNRKDLGKLWEEELQHELP
jgi:hypothetical protein